ncbi:unnamed protein product [Peronospora belbahrii]|nr:unnamed protein product [Peronospora belbahrii]
MLHAAKWPANSICGVLLGQEKGQSFLIVDAVPLFHHETPLTPLVEVACAMVDTYCQKSLKLKIVGFYYAENGSFSSNCENKLSHFTEKVADRVEQNCSRACVLVVNKNQLQHNTTSGLQLLLKDVKRGWTRVENRLTVVDEAATILTKGLEQTSETDVVDFEEHLEDPRKDWRNLHIVDLLKLNVSSLEQIT